MFYCHHRRRRRCRSVCCCRCCCRFYLSLLTSHNNVIFVLFSRIRVYTTVYDANFTNDFIVLYAFDDEIMRNTLFHVHCNRIIHSTAYILHSFIVLCECVSMFFSFFLLSVNVLFHLFLLDSLSFRFSLTSEKSALTEHEISSAAHLCIWKLKCTFFNEHWTCMLLLHLLFNCHNLRLEIYSIDEWTCIN